MAPTERNGAAGRTPTPSGRGGSRSPAAASSVKVDTRDVQKLSTLLGESASNAEKLAKALSKFDSSALSKVNSEVQALRAGLTRTGVGTGRSTGSGSTPSGGSGSSYLPRTTISGTEHIGVGNGGGSYLSGHWAAPLGKVGGTAAFLAYEGATSLAGLMAGHIPDATNRSYLLNRWQLQTGGGMGYGAQVGLGRNLAGMFGNNTLGYADTTQAASTLLQSGAVSGGLGQSRVASAAFGAALNPMSGASGGAQMTARVFTSQNYYRARLAGVNQMAGGQQNLQRFMDQVITRYEASAGHKLSQAEIQSGNQQGMPLYLTLVGLGFQDDGDRQNLLTYWSARNRTGKTGTAALNAAGANNGMFRTAQQMANAQGQALSQADVGGMRGMTRAMRAKTAMYQFLGNQADTPFGRVITDATGSLSIFSGELKTVNRLIETLIGASILKKVVGAAGGGAAADAATTTVAGAGAGGALTTGAGTASRLARVGRAGFAATVLDFAGHASSYGSQHKASPHNWGAKRWLAPAASAWAGVKGVGHDAMSAVNTVMSPLDSLFGIGGDSNRKTAPLSDTGTTWPQLAKIGKSGPPNVVTSTVTGTHAQNSYHYRGQAVDFAAPGGGQDTPGLLAINRYWASRYGRKLKELIYAGPGGVCIKDGKVVNGMAFYGAATMAEHHNHVHVAATPASLGGAGGGVPVGAASGNNAGTGSVDAAPASSSGGFAGGSLIGSLFGTSSGSSLLAALATIGGGGRGYAASAMSGGSASSGATTSGRAASGAGMGVGSAPSNVSGNVALARKMAASMGWTGKEWDALYAVWNQESSFRTNAGSPAKAYGIPQAMPGSKMASAGADWMTNARTQIKWGLGYIKQGYKDPLGALAHKHATDSNLGSHALYAQPGGWYEGGKWRLIRDEIAQLHKGEMVVPATTAEKLRQAISAPASSSSGGKAGGSGRRAVPVQLVFMVQRGTEAEMRQAARKFAQYVADDHDIELVSSS